MKKIKTVLSGILLVILVPILFVCAVILMDSYKNPNEVPSFFGWKPLIVLSGSMEPEIYSGDVAVVKEVDVKKLKERDIIALKDGNVVITHRIVDIVEENGTRKFKTKGDNNNVEDSEYVLAEQVEGIYRFKIDKMGDAAMYIQTPMGMLICLSIPLALLMLLQMFDSNGNKKRETEDEGEKHEKEN